MHTRSEEDSEVMRFWPKPRVSIDDAIADALKALNTEVTQLSPRLNNIGEQLTEMSDKLSGLEKRMDHVQRMFGLNGEDTHVH
jgi:archaellum component FlaC